MGGNPQPDNSNQKIRPTKPVNNPHLRAVSGWGAGSQVGEKSRGSHDPEAMVCDPGLLGGGQGAY